MPSICSLFLLLVVPPAVIGFTFSNPVCSKRKLLRGKSDEVGFSSFRGNPFISKVDEVLLMAKREKTEESDGIKEKLIAESIAPWRTLRLFLYAALGSGAALGGFITLSGVAAALSGVRSDVDLNTEYLNLAIDFGAAASFAVFFKLDFDKGSELSESVQSRLEQKKENLKVAEVMSNRAKELSNLSLSIRVTADGQMQEAKVGELQSGAKQHVIIVAGPRKAINDALLGANLMKLSDFAMNNVLVVPYEIGTAKDKVKPSGGFGERPAWESKPYVAEPTGQGWESYVEKEMTDAVNQNGDEAKNKGIAIVVASSGKVIRRGVGTVPWRKMVDELNEVTGKEKEVDVSIPFLTD